MCAYHTSSSKWGASSMAVYDAVMMTSSGCLTYIPFVICLFLCKGICNKNNYMCIRNLLWHFYYCRQDMFHYLLYYYLWNYLQLLLRCVLRGKVIWRQVTPSYLLWLICLCDPLPWCYNRSLNGKLWCLGFSSNACKLHFSCMDYGCYLRHLLHPPPLDLPPPWFPPPLALLLAVVMS